MCVVIVSECRKLSRDLSAAVEFAVLSGLRRGVIIVRQHGHRCQQVAWCGGQL